MSLQLCTDVALSKYRTVDGSCNHPKNWGTSFTPVARILPPAYDDNVGSPRTRGKDGYPLPNPRTISSYVHPSTSDPAARTIMVMQWGQWLDHDITEFPVVTNANGPVKCCGPNGTLPTGETNPNCFPILLPCHEVNFAGSCMEFIRSVGATDRDGCLLNPREQVNSLTSFVDGSQIYGSTEELATRLRDGTGILLKTKKGFFLPEDESASCILRPGTNDYCFLSGDHRVNVQPGLGAMHTIWLRAHNSLAKELRSVRPADSNEEIFQLTRKIIGALQQVITYNEWLPIILGTEASKLKLTSKTGRTTLIPEVDPRILNEFATAAMRFGHSLIPEVLPIGSRKVLLRKLFNRPAEVLENLDDLIAGIAGVSRVMSESVDRNFVEEITNHLFEPPAAPKGRGLDLVSLNLQRGRDHGIPPYRDYRKVCGLRPIVDFDDTEALGPYAAQLARVYKSVDDIDLFTGLVHERPLRGAMVGPTLSCILGTQFYNLKYGDRFFFDTDDSAIAFSDGKYLVLLIVSLYIIKIYVLSIRTSSRTVDIEID
ncbi:peroxidasin-like [Biomphalaria glabrata]|uniref:Peroxidasin-like n=1 Tax=Biomphalaria glabrata TaxID=6526 RepID=A0A9W3A514_BIOGL|nr:peroxidasin-like [Biomphalaria glabrata]